jgi:hypothetical protein
MSHEGGTGNTAERDKCKRTEEHTNDTRQGIRRELLGDRLNFRTHIQRARLKPSAEVVEGGAAIGVLGPALQHQRIAGVGGEGAGKEKLRRRKGNTYNPGWQQPGLGMR